MSDRTTTADLLLDYIREQRTPPEELLRSLGYSGQRLADYQRGAEEMIVLITRWAERGTQI